MKMKVIWEGKMRNRILGKPKYWNAVRWLKDEGLDKQQVLDRLYKKAKIRLIKTGKHGKRKQLTLAGMKYRIRKAVYMFYPH